MAHVAAFPGTASSSRTSLSPSNRIHHPRASVISGQPNNLVPSAMLIHQTRLSLATAASNSLASATQAPGPQGSGPPSNISSSNSSSSPPPNDLNFSLWGTWVKDTAASDLASYSRALDLMQLGRLEKTAALSLIEGMVLQRSGSAITLKFLTGQSAAGATCMVNATGWENKWLTDG